MGYHQAVGSSRCVLNDQPPLPTSAAFRVMAGDLDLNIIATALFGNSPSSNGAADVPNSISPFQYGPDNLVGLQPSAPGSVALALRKAEHDELWSNWQESLPTLSGVPLFVGNKTRDDVFRISSGQVGLTEH